MPSLTLKKVLPHRWHVHLIGIGGIGMSALAQYYKSRGDIVSGSDITKSSITDALRKKDIAVSIGHARKNIPAHCDLVIYNRAIPSTNPELLGAEKQGIPTLPYAKALGTITETHETIAITGSHGKSTTTALAALALIRGGLDPTVLVGTNLKEFGGGNFRRGAGSHLVLEADDFGGAFFEYSPAIAIVTNVDEEHMDFYKSFANVKRAFLRFMETTRPGGTLILNHNDGTLRSLTPKIRAIAKKKSLTVIWYSAKNLAHKKLKSILKLPGAHNLSNAMAVYELGRVLKLPEKKTLQAISSYNGSWRRMEFRRDIAVGANKIKVFDDYAHHPTEIKATLRGFKEKYPHSPLICVFQPHQAARLRLLFNGFVSAFGDADILALIPAYRVSGRDRNANNSKDEAYTSERLAGAIAKKYPKKSVFYFSNPKHIKQSIAKILAAQFKSSARNFILVMMGAGDIVTYTDFLIK